MTYDRFEDLPVWKAAVDLAMRLFTLTDRADFPHKGDLKSQLERASLSISNNIAEGFERGSTTELINFLYIARGSAGEVRSMLKLIQAMESASSIASEATSLASQVESISRQLRAWADKLQNTEVKGQRHLNDQKRKQYDDERRAQAFVERIKAEHEVRMQQLLSDQARRRESSGDETDQDPKKPYPK